jgi:hypothetical protein
MRLAPTKHDRSTAIGWCGIRPLRTPQEVGEILNIPAKEVARIEREIFKKLRQALPPAKNRLEAVPVREVAWSLWRCSVGVQRALMRRSSSTPRPI